MLLVPRLSHVAVSAFVLCWVVMAVVWLASSEYARKESVQGWIEPASGITRVYARDSGVLAQILVDNGDYVSEGDALVMITADRVLADGSKLGELTIEEISKQHREILDQIDNTARLTAAESEMLDSEVAQARSQIASLVNQLDNLQARLRLTRSREGRAKRLLERGVLAAADLDPLISERLTVEAEHESAQARVQDRRADIHRLQLAKASLPLMKQQDVAALRRQASELQQQLAVARSGNSRIIRAPRDGYVGNLQARVGKQTNESTPLLTIGEKHEEFVSVLLVPVRAVGFVDVGQAIGVRYDAFPYQKFGVYQGRVVEISDTVLLPGELVDSPLLVREPVYRVSADLDGQGIDAYGKRVDLKPGMTLSADINLSRRTLVEWLIEPILSLRGRL